MQRSTVATDTRDRILAAAERLFGARGFDATSMRDVTAAAGVNLAAVHYHFGSKRALLEAVVRRVLLPVNASRAERLDGLEAAAAPPTLDDLLAAFVEPVFAAFDSRTERGGVLAKLFGRVVGDPDEETRRIVIAEAGPVEDRFLLALGRALPDLPEDELAWRFRALIGLLVSQQAGLLRHPGATEPDPAAERAWLVAVLRAALLADPAPKSRRS